MFGIDIKYILAAIFVIVIAVVFVITFLRNRRIRKDGIKADAVVGIRQHELVAGQIHAGHVVRRHGDMHDRQHKRHQHHDHEQHPAGRR